MLMMTGPSCCSGKELSTVIYSEGPLHSVAITGMAILIASTCGRPHPSPLDGKTKQSEAAYMEGIDAVGMPLGKRCIAGNDEAEADSVLVFNAGCDEMNSCILCWKSASL